MVRRHAFTKNDVEQRRRLSDITEDDRQKLTELVVLARVRKPAELVRDLMGLVRRFRSDKLANSQERPAAVAEALNRILLQEKAMHEAFQLAPLSVRVTAYDKLGRPEPTGEGIHRLSEEIKRLNAQVATHKTAKASSALKDHVRELVLLAERQSPYLADNERERTRWVLEALILSGENIPKTNVKAWLGRLLPTKP